MVRQLLTIILIGTTVSLSSQTVDSIKVEQAGDFIRIGYKILNSTPSQVYRVKVLCSMDRGMNYEIRSITGDVGENVAGGKSDYWVVWDVLKDVEELGSVEFIVRAELVRDISQTGNLKKTKNKYGKFFILGLTDMDFDLQFRLGGRIGYLDKFGIAARFTSGYIVDDFAQGSVGIETKIPVFNASLDLVARVVNNMKAPLYFFAGPAMSKLKAEQEYAPTNMEPNYYKSYPGFNLGIIQGIGRLSITLGFAAFPNFNLEDNYQLRNDTFVSAGIGINF